MDQFHDNAIMLHELHNTRRTRPVHSSILNETIARVTDILGSGLAGITVERAVVGLFSPHERSRTLMRYTGWFILHRDTAETLKRVPDIVPRTGAADEAVD